MSTTIPAEKTRVSAGMTFRKVVGDANALWKVIGKHDAKTWLVEVQPETIEIPDGKGGTRSIECTDYVGQQDVMTSSQILHAHNWPLRWQRLGAKQAEREREFCDTLSVGQVIHYVESPPFKGSDQHPPIEGRWIRYEYLGDGQFRPVALVGGWGRVETGVRYANGQTGRGYHAQKVLAGEPTSLQSGDIIENSASRKQTSERASDPTYVAALPALDLSIPEPNPAEQRLAQIMQAMETAVEHASGRGIAPGGGDLDLAPETAADRLDAVEQLLRDALA